MPQRARFHRPLAWAFFLLCGAQLCLLWAGALSCPACAAMTGGEGLLFALYALSAPRGFTPAPAPPLPARQRLQENLLLNQINPHFLYNTLESIRGKALQDGNGQVADMVEALSSFFRYNVSSKSGIVTLADEVGSVDEYLKIQNFRFNGRFVIEKHIDQTVNLHGCCLPKLTLQPIVENAIVHGLESLEQQGSIVLRIEDAEPCIRLSVADNGAGMSEQALEALNHSLFACVPAGDEDSQRRAHSGIALINVNQRIKLFFGAQYTLMIYSSEGSGTTVELLIPKLDPQTAAEKGEMPR